MAAAVYILCFLTAAACACLLLDAHRKNRAPLLLWSGLCFVGLAANEALLVVDLLVIPQRSLLAARTAVGLVSVCLMLFGLIFHTKGSTP